MPNFQLFLQVFIISAVNASTAALYAYMQFVHSNETLMVIAQIGWLSCHGRKFYIPQFYYENAKQ